ncbi:MAG: hypothetical protein DSZ28_07135 [Thiothrix sp.]|nr:MAG: hypothetical protein DSZ28_07135 [Thiothrix sp.]
MLISKTMKLCACGMENYKAITPLSRLNQTSLRFRIKNSIFIMGDVFLSICLIYLITALNGNKAYSADKIENTDEHTTSAFNSKREIPDPLYGITIDAIDPLDKIIDSISSLPKQMTTRVVFDEWVPAAEYTEALEALHPKSYIMGEILDSFYVKDYSIAQYSTRVKEYLDTLGDKVDIWEIGNEVNGEWLGNPDHVTTKIEDAYQQVKARDYKTALTLYYNKDCWAHSWEEMFQWAETRLSNNLRSGLDYLLVSYYEEDCNNLKPDWRKVFTQLGKLFPNAKLAFGEVGTSKSGKKADYLKRYYTMKIDHPRYVGGHFWWYFIQDMVPKTKPLWSILETQLKDTKQKACTSEPYQLSDNTWKLISLPCQPPTDANTVTSVFESNGTADYGTAWIVYRYDTNSKKYAPLKADDIIKQGIGYWIIQITGKAMILNMPNNSKATPVTHSNACSSTQGCFEMTLSAQANTTQWNLLGHPFIDNSALNRMRIKTNNTDEICTQTKSCSLQEAETAGIVSSKLWHYVDNETGYIALADSDSTSPWDGFWSATTGKANDYKPTLLIPAKD